ncbi:MAG: GIY-YIG nuclease family protein, partial [Alphaproteobacteria bacterium]|nr:GIY-YIG nuclease family protein [Alphaproteobacteria bacterium]
MPFYVYMMSNKKYGVLYIGMTNHLSRRVYEHRSGLQKGFSQKYKTKQLIYFEEYETAYEAIVREKSMKKWNREWKLQ